MEDIKKEMCSIEDSIFKILVTHHPFIPPLERSSVDLVGRSLKALNIIDKCGIELLLSGHLHHGYSGDVRSFYPSRNRSIISVQAGTAISRRIRNERNSYNLIAVDNNTEDIQIRKWMINLINLLMLFTQK